jgi:hypothetical protein
MQAATNERKQRFSLKMPDTYVLIAYVIILAPVKR